MIAAIIICLSVFFALVFTLAYFLKPDLRDQIERPKYAFQDQLRRYNCETSNANSTNASTSDEQ